MTDEPQFNIHVGQLGFLVEGEEKASRHWYTCTHLADCDEIIREAEGIAIFSSRDGRLVHISISDYNADNGQTWFSCKPLGTAQYESLSQAQLMELIQGELRFLRSIRE